MTRFFNLLACLAALLILFGPAGSTGQTTNEAKVWTRLAAAPVSRAEARWVEPERGEYFTMDQVAFKATAQKVARGEPSEARTSGMEITLPMPDGSTARFSIVEAPIMEPGLAARFPEMKTYAGQGIDDPDATVRMDLTPVGFHAQILSPRGAVYVDPAFRGDTNTHIAYWKRDLRKAAAFQCSPPIAVAAAADSGAPVQAQRTLSGATLRTYRLAVSATGEYTTYFGGTVQLGMAAIVTAINRVNGVYENELAVRLVLVSNNDLLIYTDGNSDPFTNQDEASMLGENQAVVDAVIGTSNYDIGHIFGTGGGGIATLGSVCHPSYKAQGATGSSNPVGDAFYIDYVAHEMGHQFGANHTFNSETGSCGGGTRVGFTAFEPGSGSTIMAYAGICSINDLQPHSDPYFHAGSLDEIQAFVSNGGGCAAGSVTGNTAPVPNAGADYAIPANTPFVLTASATDANGDSLTYCWEQMDVGAATSLSSPDSGSGPLFRSLSPSTSPIRYFPKLSSVVANTNWNQEKLPTTSRTMNFRMTVRDNRPGGGGVADDDMIVTVVGTAGPFAVTSPNTAVSWTGSQTVTWNVAGTTASPINAANVNIFLSVDGGQTFPYQLASNVPNNGSRLVTLPSLSTSQARMKVQAVGNIFYDISDANFTIIPNGPVVSVSNATLIAESCLPANGWIDPFETVTVNFTLRNTGTAPTTNLLVTLLQTNGVYYPSAAQNYGAIPVGGTATRSFSFVPSANCGASVTASLLLSDNGFAVGTADRSFTLGSIQSTVVTQIFNNTSPITIPLLGVASPSPSSIPVAGVSGQVTKVTATLNGFGHGYPEDVAVLLVAPNGQAVKLMDMCGGGADKISINLTFDDAAASSLPFGTALVPGTFLPTDYFPEGGLTGAPQPPYQPALLSLGTVPNGTWSLYVQDFSDGDSGQISGGWTLRIVSSNFVASCCTTFPAPAFTSTTYSNGAVRFSWNAIPGPHYQVQYRTNLTAGSWLNLGAPVLGTNTLMTVTDGSLNSPTRFYRVIAQP